MIPLGGSSEPGILKPTCMVVYRNPMTEHGVVAAGLSSLLQLHHMLEAASGASRAKFMIYR